METVRTSRPFSSALNEAFLRRRSSAAFRCASAFLLPLSGVYHGAVVVRRLASRPRRFPFRVVSVGNLTAGGTGKTTLVRLIAGRLLARGLAVAAATSGVGARRGLRVAAGRGAARDAAGFGDEAAMLGARLPGLLIVRGASKTRMLAALAEAGGTDIAIVDDGFHAAGIWKDREVLVFDATNPFDNGRLIPAGLLREPPAAARRADVFVVTHREAAGDGARGALRRLEAFGAPIVFMDYRIGSLADPRGGEEPSSVLEGRRVVAFAGIGNPGPFFRLLSAAGAAAVHAVVFPDHFPYRRSDVEAVEALARRRRADLVVTTEKDAVKVLPFFSGAAPLRIVRQACLLNGVPEGSPAFDNVIDGIYNSVSPGSSGEYGRPR